MERSKIFMPDVVFANYFVQGRDMEVGERFDRRFIYDYELELVTYSNGGAMIQNGQLVNVQKGDIIFNRPGETTQAVMSYNSYIFSFDLMENHRMDKEGYILMAPKAFQAPIEHALINELPRCFHTEHYERYLDFFKEVIDCFAGDNTGRDSYLGALVIRLLYEMNKEHQGRYDHKHEKSNDISSVLKYIDSHLTENLSLKMLSERLHMSSVYFHQVFSEVVGVPPKVYIIGQRIQKSRELLVHTGLSVKEIGSRVGYCDPAYFCYAFKRVEGISPKKYRAQHQLRLH